MGEKSPVAWLFLFGYLSSTFYHQFMDDFPPT